MSLNPLWFNWAPGQEDGLSRREAYAKPFYDKAESELFGEFDYTLIAPMKAKSIFLSDETVCVARHLFGEEFDFKVRSVAAKYWLPLILFQILGLLGGLIVFSSERYNPYYYLLTIPGAVFPVLLLLRSHWRIMKHMFQQFEPMFLSLYSLVFCISVISFSGAPLSAFFIFLVLYPTLLTCVFIDCSSLRLDYAFIKGHISTLALAMPPGVISLICVLCILILYYARRGDTSFTNGVGVESFLISTGTTLAVFIAKSIGKMLYDPSRCMTLHCPMVISIAHCSIEQDIDSSKDCFNNDTVTRSSMLDIEMSKERFTLPTSTGNVNPKERDIQVEAKIEDKLVDNGSSYIDYRSKDNNRGSGPAPGGCQASSTPYATVVLRGFAKG